MSGGGGVTPSPSGAQAYEEERRDCMRAGGSNSTAADLPVPADLGDRGRAMWEQTTEGLDWRPDEVALLHEFCRTLDEVDALRETIREGGMSVVGSKGQPRPNPLLASLHASRALLIRLAQQLALPDEGEEVGQTHTSRQAQRAAQPAGRATSRAKGPPRMPRRRAPEPAPLPSTGAPDEVLVGAVVGVWGDDLLTALRHYAIGRRQWEVEAGLDRATSCRLVPAGRPVEGEDAVARLQRLGLPVDLDRLRVRAEERLS